MQPRLQTTTPPTFNWTWATAALAAAGGLIAQYGFHEPLLNNLAIRIVLISAFALFITSRIFLFFPGSEVVGRLKRWWPDFVIILAAITWWAIDPSREPVILRVAALYILVLGAGWSARGVFRWLLDRTITGRPLMWPLAATLSIAAMLGGLFLSLPVCWTAPVTGQKLSQYARHILDCTFTAAAAVTCTGLSPINLRLEFTTIGHYAIFILIQLGGLLTLTLGTAAAWRWWYHPNNSAQRDQLNRLLRWMLMLVVLAEVTGSLALYATFDRWNAMTDSSAVATSLIPDRAFLSVFHAVSAFCNSGLTLTSDNGFTNTWPGMLFGCMLPLMLLGSIGLPALYELWRRCFHRTPLSPPARITLLSSLVLILGGAALIYGIESTRPWQLRYPRFDTPGKLHVAADTLDSNASETKRTDTLATQSPIQRATDSIFLSIDARTAGFKRNRLDETSITPATHAVLMFLMFVGGGIGGTAGGIRILTIWLCLAAIFRTRRHASNLRAPWRTVGAMFLLIAVTAFILLYRDVGSFQSSLFESISACCNVGLSTGLTSQLYVEAKIALTLAMLLGRAIPFLDLRAQSTTNAEI